MPQIFKPELREIDIDPLKFWYMYAVPRAAQNAKPDQLEWPMYVKIDEGLTEAQIQAHPDGFTVNKDATHNGDMENTYKLIWDVLHPIAFMKIMHPRHKGRKDYNAIKYTISHIHVSCEAGTGVFLPQDDGKMTRGNRETAVMHVISEPYMANK